MSTLNVDNIKDGAGGDNVVMPAGYVVQTISETITAQLAGSVGSAGTYIDTGVTASITPKFSNSKILVSFVFGAVGADSSGDSMFRLIRTSTAIAQGASGTYVSTIATRNLNSEISSTPSFMHLDSPSTTSATTYKVQGSLSGSGTLAINRRQSDTPFGTASSITLQEIAQ